MNSLFGFRVCDCVHMFRFVKTVVCGSFAKALWSNQFMLLKYK
jgi:hypothetical protein